MQTILFDKRFQLIVRSISLCCAIFLILVEIRNWLTEPCIIPRNINSYVLIWQHIANSIVVVLCFLQAIFPNKLEFLATTAFYYGIICSIHTVENPMGICMYILGNSVFYARGYYIFKTKRKLFIAITIYCLLDFTILRFGFRAFIDDLIMKLGYGIVIICIIFLIQSRNHRIKKDISQKAILNLADYCDLQETDLILLQKVLENKPYKIIASEVYRAEGTVRNRLNKIYDILGVMDKMGFLTTYMGYEIIFRK